MLLVDGWVIPAGAEAAGNAGYTEASVGEAVAAVSGVKKGGGGVGPGDESNMAALPLVVPTAPPRLRDSGVTEAGTSRWFASQDSAVMYHDAESPRRPSTNYRPQSTCTGRAFPSFPVAIRIVLLQCLLYR